MRRVAIVSAVRTGIGKYAGQWVTTPSEKLAAAAIREAVDRAGIDPNEIEDVVMGNLHGHHGNHARIASLTAGLPFEAGAVTVDRQCGSGSQAIIYAALNIAAGYGDVYVACGVEHMTLNPYQVTKVPNYSYAPPQYLTNRVSTDEAGNPPYPKTADILGNRMGITREECDAWAYQSQLRAAAAIENHLFDEQIVPVEVKTKKGVQTVTADECVRFNASLEAMAKLPVLYEGGLCTAGNSCPRSDGAAAVVMMSEERAKALGIEPMGYFKTFAAAGLDPNIMGYGPVPATRKALKRAGLTIKDIDLVELNEAFAAQVVPCVKDLGLDPEKTNPNGGAIAMGHPLGGTGVILTTKLLYEMIRKDYELGLVTMCIGGGQGLATIFERR